MKYKKLKPRKRKFKDSKILLLLILLMCIGIGYAALTTTLSINGTTNVATNSWNIHFANLNIDSGSVSGSPAASLSGYNMNITYGAELQNPGDYYEFTVDVVNEGTLPGKVSIVNLTGNNTEYLNTNYSYNNGNSINLGDILNAGKSKKLKIKAWIPSDIDTSLLPTSDTPITLTFNLQYVQSEEDAPPDATGQIIALAANNSCIEKYEGQVTDQPGETVAASNVYFNKCADKRNIIFNNMCWQMIRTTETGGIKMLYNGEPDGEGKCLNTRNDHKGIVGALSSTENLNAEYLYGTTFTYDTTTNEFTLVDTETATWSDSTYENLIGKFTCKNSTGTCTTLYNVNGYESSTTAYTSSYTIGDTNYAQIGTSSYNASYKSLSMVGYMFNKTYNFKGRSISGTIKFGSTYTYSNGTCSLSGTTQDLTTLAGKDISNTHYTCWNSTGICTNISYVFVTNGTIGYYIEINDGKSITDVINEMLYNDDVNRYDSTIKGIIDSWYVQNLSTMTNMLEDTLFCNDRNMSNQSTNGWNPAGGNTSTFLYFKSRKNNKDISCTNETDQFAVSNNKAKLTYPVGLLQDEEKNNIGVYSLMSIGVEWWEISPSFLDFNYAGNIIVQADGTKNNKYVRGAYGVRPVVSLANGAVISGGTGSESDPWIIQE